MVFITERLLCNACCCAVILGVPFGKSSQTLAQGGGRLIAEVLFEGSGIGISDRDIAWLHGNEFLVLLEIVVGRKDIGTNKLLLKDVDKVEQVLGTVVANVIDLVGRDGKAIVAIGLFGCMLHDTHYAFDDIIDVGEIAFTLAVVEYLDGFATTQLVGEAKICHIGASSRTIDGKEAETRGWNVVELGIGMGQQFVALLGSGIERHRIVDLVVGAVRYLLVGTIDGA